MSAGTLALASSALTLLLVVPASAAVSPEGPEQVLSALPEQAWADSISPLAPGVTPLEPSVTVLEPGISPLESRSSDGEETVISLASDILFAFDAADLDTVAEERIAELLEDIPDGAPVQVHGHTDGLGGAAYNQGLSQERAGTVADVIAEARPDLELEVEGFGMERPVEPNELDGEDNPEGRALNRRVEIRYDR